MSETKNELRAALAAGDVFRGCGEADLDRLVGGARIRVLEDGDLLWRWGELGKELAVVLEGSLEISRDQEGAKTIRFRRMGAGSVLGFAALSGEAFSADVRAVGRARVALVPGPAIEAMLSENPRVALRMIAVLGDLVGRLSDELGELRTLDLDERLLRWLRRNADDDSRVRITHQQLATFVGATRANVSRALARAAAEGHVRLGRGWIVLPPR